eukprot:CAMPEP_0119003346 /NCGR_PEP_ID=MMETSP1176-20130426/506_1 /TAXON_ID=265551 /ORGANISM="Synedropsis recta cf, Strain CCMP1620" /LENGTH=694 /DNA_ID=CAMNT_0006954941 /DNA_START=22 /DNA_END=2106 /DNA_ORIENTATION=+
MRFISILLASAIFVASSDIALAEKEKGRQTSTLFKDDQKYWNRVLQKSDNSMPTPPPTPTTPPCDVDVDTTCALDDDSNADCSVLEDVTELQCSGCAPTTLCFIYTAAPCPSEEDLPPGMTSCNDFSGGPQMMADISVSNGMEILIDESVRAGAEVCISDGGAELPDELFVFINAPGGGMDPTANQLSVIDSTCSEQGLTLLQSYGALDLVHYINSCQGDNDCFVPITYTHKVTNDGPVGLTITDLDRNLNGDELDLLDGVSPADLRLEEGEMFTKEDPVVAECCTGAGLDMSTTVISEGDDGSICEDTDTVDVDKPIATGVPAPPDTTAPTPATPPPIVPATPEPTPIVPATPEPTPVPATPDPTPVPATPEPTPEATDPPVIAPVTPGPTPFMPPPGDECFIQVQTDCTPPPQFEDCDSMTPPRDECGEMVFSMGFRYLGGDCSNSDNVQDTQIFSCEDYQGGPPTEGEVSSFIRVTDIKGLGINYYTGFVPLEGDFELTNGGEILGANVNATIYSTDITTPENILQTMIIHTSCSQVTFLKDKYGGIQLLSFNNTLQGFVSCFVDLTLGFNILNAVENNEDFTVIVDSLSSITNFDDNLFINLTDQVAGTQLAPGETLSPIPTTVVTIDLSIRQQYTAFTTIQGSSLDGFFCRSTDFLNFTASTTGNPVDTRTHHVKFPATAPVGIPMVGP